MPYFSESKSVNNASNVAPTPNFMSHTARFRQHSARNTASYNRNPFRHATLHQSNLESQTSFIDSNDNTQQSKSILQNPTIAWNTCVATAVILTVVLVIIVSFGLNKSCHPKNITLDDHFKEINQLKAEISSTQNKDRMLCIYTI